MPTQNVNLTQKHVDFVRESVASGDYNSASEVVRDAIRVLQSQKDEYNAKLDRLRAELQKGVDDIEAGRYITLKSWKEIQAHGEDGKRRGRERLAKEHHGSRNPTD